MKPVRGLDVVMSAIERGETISVVWEPAPVPPPPEPGKGRLIDPETGRPRVGRRHGFEATYRTGCRCPLCRAAHTRCNRDARARAARRRSNQSPT